MLVLCKECKRNHVEVYAKPMGCNVWQIAHDVPKYPPDTLDLCPECRKIKSLFFRAEEIEKHLYQYVRMDGAWEVSEILHRLATCWARLEYLDIDVFDLLTISEEDKKKYFTVDEE